MNPTLSPTPAFLPTLAPSGAEDIPVGAPVALVVDDKSLLEEVRRCDYSSARAVVAGAAAAAPAPAPAASAPAPAAPSAAATGVSAAISALPTQAVLPSARLLMASLSMDPAPLVARGGSGKGGRITKGDVLEAAGRIERAAPAPAAAAAVAAPAPAARPAASAAPSSSAPAFVREGGAFTDSKPSTVRRVIAARLTESKAGIPHQYMLMECRIDAMLALRAQLKEAGAACSVNDMIIKAAAKALRDVPEANCFYHPAR